VISFSSSAAFCSAVALLRGRAARTTQSPAERPAAVTVPPAPTLLLVFAVQRTPTSPMASAAQAILSTSMASAVVPANPYATASVAGASAATISATVPA